MRFQYRSGDFGDDSDSAPDRDGNPRSLIATARKYTIGKDKR